MYDMIAMIGMSHQSCWLSKAGKTLLLFCPDANLTHSANACYTLQSAWRLQPSDSRSSSVACHVCLALYKDVQIAVTIFSTVYETCALKYLERFL